MHTRPRKRAAALLSLLLFSPPALAADGIAGEGLLESSAAPPSGAVAPAAFQDAVPGFEDYPADGEQAAAEEETADVSEDSELEELSSQLEQLQSEWDDYQRTLETDEPALEDEPTMSIGGRVHLDYWGFPESDPGLNVIENGDATHDPEDRFLFRRLRLEMKGTVPHNMIWRMQVDFGEPQSPEIKDAYLGWTGLPNNQTLIFGNQKRPLGLDQLNSSRFNIFMERPMAVEAFNEDARRLGLAMYGHSDDESTGWAYGIYNLENIKDDGTYVGDSLQMGGYGRLWRSPWYDETSGGRGYWHMAVAGGVAHPDGNGSFDQDENENEGRFRTRVSARTDERWLNTGRIPGADWFETLGLESMLNIGSFQLTGEYFFTGLQRDRLGPPGGFGAPLDPPLDDDFFFHGGYLYASYFLTGEFNPYDRTSGKLGRVEPYENFFLVERCRGGRGHGWGAWQVALRYDYLDLSDGGVQGGVGNTVTGGLNWHWTPYSKLQTNLIWGDVAESGNAGAFDGGEFWTIGSRFMIDF